MSELLPLAEAAARLFTDGRITVRSLRRERDRGRLRTYMVAGKEYTTIADIMELVGKCVVTPKDRGCGSEPSAAIALAAQLTHQSGSSATAHASAARDAALMIARRLKGSSRTTSPQNTSRGAPCATRPESPSQTSSGSTSPTRSAIRLVYPK